MTISKQYTNRENQSLDIYLQEIGKCPLLTANEEIDLAKKIQGGGAEGEYAMKKLVQANLRFVVSVAKQYQNQGLPLSDLINEGNLGLIKAAKRFDETRGFKFISYAVWWIKQSILQAIAEQSRIVRLPLNRVGTLNKIGKEFSKLEQEFEREPTLAELSESLEMKTSDIFAVMQTAGKHLSVDAPFAQGEDSKLLDVLIDDLYPPPDSGLVVESLKIEIKEVLKEISEREAEIIIDFYGLDGPPLAIDEIAEKYNFTRERVRQVKERAIQKLKLTAKKDILKPYLG